MHLEGTAPPDLIRRLAERNGLPVPEGVFAGPDRFAYTDFLDFLKTYDKAASVIRTGDDYRDISLAYLTRCAAEGAIYVELTASPDHAKLVGLSDDEHLDGIARGIDDARAHSGIEARILISCVRNFGVEPALRVARYAAQRPHPYVVAFSMAGDGDQGTPGEVPRVPSVTLPLIEDIPFVGDAIGKTNLLTWAALLLVPLLTVYLFRTRGGLRLRSVGEKPRAADSVGLPVIRTRYLAVIASGALAALGGVYLSIALLGSFSENMTAGRGFIALAAVIFGSWRPFGALAGALLFGFSSALAQRLPAFSESTAVLFQALPCVLTLVVVAGVIGRSRPPAAIGVPFVKE